ncbi:MAG: hypothetical protein ACT4OK_02180 [Gemmobacter sp.]
MQQRPEVYKTPVPPLRAEPRFDRPSGGAVQAVEVSSGGLIRSTLMAGGAALAILTLFWLPAEYGIDPTGAGRLMGLTEMGAIKQQLAGEAAAQDAAAAAVEPATITGSGTIPGDVAVRLDRIEAQLARIAAVIGADVAPLAPAPAVEAVAEPGSVAPAEPEVAAAAPGWRDEMVFTLAPTESKEIKLEMAAGDVATFEWASDGGGVNYTQHGDDGGANEVRFEDGRASPGQDGTMTAPFAGKHGWFWRNRGDGPVTVTLRVGGAYSQLVEVE